MAGCVCARRLEYTHRNRVPHLKLISSGPIVLTNVLQYAFWTLAVILQMAVGVLLIKRRVYLRFPAFLCYTAFEVFRSVALFAIILLRTHLRSAYKMYFDFYWITDAIWIALSLLVLYEVSQNFFRDYPLGRKIASVAFTIGTMGLLWFDVYWTTVAPGHERNHLISFILLIDRNLAAVEAGLVVVLFICAQLMALPWRANLSFGISLGLGILQGVNLAAVSTRALLGRAVNEFYAIGKMFAYALAVVVWLVYISPPQTTTKVCVDSTIASADVEDWNEALKDVLNQ